MVKQDPKRGKTMGKGRGGGGAPVESAFEKKRAKPVLEEVDEGRSSAFVDRRIGQDGDSAEVMTPPPPPVLTLKSCLSCAGQY
jgi:hypothetical protein